MNQKEITNQLEKLRSINPDQIFFSRSKRVVLAIEPNRRIGFGLGLFSPIFLGGAFVVLIAVAAGSIVFFSSVAERPAYASLNSEKINKELDSLTINIRLQEIQYNQSIKKTISSALREIGNDETRHLNKDVLELEKDALDIPPSSAPSETVDDLLDEIIK